MATDHPVSFARRQTFWESGSLRCISIATKAPTSFAVYVFHGDNSLCMEPCNNTDEATILAQRMWQLFVERLRPCSK
jgi:hypothetical protein